MTAHHKAAGGQNKPQAATSPGPHRCFLYRHHPSVWVGICPSRRQTPLHSAGSTSGKLARSSGVGQRINKNKQTSRSRKLGGGTGPTCSAEGEANAAAAAKVSRLAWRTRRPQTAAQRGCRVSDFTRPGRPCVLLAAFVWAENDNNFPPPVSRG